MNNMYEAKLPFKHLDNLKELIIKLSNTYPEENESFLELINILNVCKKECELVQRDMDMTMECFTLIIDKEVKKK